MSTDNRYPLHWPTGWPVTEVRSESRFGTWNNRPSLAHSRDHLMAELKRMGADEIILSTNIELRKDGLPYSNRREPENPGAAVYFKWKDQDMVIASDKYDRVGCNVWAMYKTIEALRGIDRWGCSEMLNRAFTGFKALPEQASEGVQAWYNVLEVSQNASKSEIKAAHRRLVKKYHPDSPTGNAAKFQQVQSAYQQAIS